MYEQMPEEENIFVELSKINVNKYTEKKGKPGSQLTYLSWAWAWDQLKRRDPKATYHHHLFEKDGVASPVMKIGETAMVWCSVEAFGIKHTMQLPVMDYRNDPITNPDSFQVNTAMQRCLAKAISMHGIGLYIYAGEDLPLSVAQVAEDLQDQMRHASDAQLEELKVTVGEFVEENPELRDQMLETYRIRKTQLAGTTKATKPGVQGLKDTMKGKDANG